MAERVEYGSSAKATEDDAGVPVLRMGNLTTSGDILADNLKYLPSSHDEFPRLLLTRGELLFNRTNSAELVGKTAVYQGQPSPCSFASYLIRVVMQPSVLPKLVAAYINGPPGRDWVRTMISQQVGQANVNGTKLKALSLPIPPLNEQRRIVDKIEALTARSRRAKEALDAVPALLDKLRQSILAAAFRGDLTRDWRAAHPDVEPASALLERIRQERRQRWEATELAKLTAKGKPPKNDNWKAKYQEPEPVDTEGLPELPEGWAWAQLEDLCDVVRGIPYGIVLTGEDTPGGVPTVRCGDIKEFNIEVERLKRVMPEIAEQFERTSLVGGEVLIAIRGTVGATAVVSEAMAGMNISREVAMIPVLSGMSSRFLMYQLAGPAMQLLVRKHVKGVAQAGINLADLRTLPVPVPCAQEQQRIVAAIEQSMSKLQTTREVRIALENHLGVLDSSVLAKAFRGELVPQDPNDEPASALLERIRAERGAEGSAKKAKKKRSTKKKARKTA